MADRPLGAMAEPDPGPPVVAIGTPLVLWASYFLAVQLRWGIAWPAELWAGSVVFAALGGFALSLLMVPPPAPVPPGGPEEA